MLCVSSAVISGPGPGPAPALSRVSAQRHGHTRVAGLPLLPRHGALHPADRCPGAAALGPHGHGPAVSAARLLVSKRALSMLIFQINLFTHSFIESMNKRRHSGLHLIPPSRPILFPSFSVCVGIFLILKVKDEGRCAVWRLF